MISALMIKFVWSCQRKVAYKPRHTVAMGYSRKNSTPHLLPEGRHFSPLLSIQISKTA